MYMKDFEVVYDAHKKWNELELKKSVNEKIE
jgi:hypothetical protein